MKNCIKIALLFVLVLVLSSFDEKKQLNIFISPAGSDGNNGTIASPLQSIGKAQSLIRSLRKSNSYSKITVNLMPGVYKIKNALTFNYEDGGDVNCNIEYKAYKKGEVYISGGEELPKQWVKDLSGKNIWKLELNNNSTIVNQLFADGARLIRCRSPLFFTTGPINLCKPDIEAMLSAGAEKFNKNEDFKAKDLLPFVTFAYHGTDLDDLKGDDLDDAEILLYNSWETSWHKIQRIETTRSEVYLKSPGPYPVGFFADKNRYYIENAKKYLKSAGNWYYNKKNKEVWYVSKDNEDPNKMNFVIPVTKKLMDFNGNRAEKKMVENIKFSGIKFQYTIAPRGINDRNWKSALSTVPWIDKSTGFGGKQGAVGCGEAVKLSYSSNIVFDECAFTQLGAYAIRIDSGSNANKIINSKFNSLGGGGIIIGFPVIMSDGDDAANICPVGNTVKNCTIHDIGIIYTSSLGIGIMNAVKSDIDGNEIYNTPYSGISCGWTWGRGKSYTRDNLIQNNNIHHVMQELADGGGIYTLGNQPNTNITGNTIHDIGRNANATGALNNGLFFDEGSARISIDQNKIFNIKNGAVRYNITEEANMEWGSNEIEGSSYDGSDGEGIVPQQKIQAWISDGRLVKVIKMTLKKSPWIYYTPLLLIPIIVLIFRSRKKKRKARHRSR